MLVLTIDIDSGVLIECCTPTKEDKFIINIKITQQYNHGL